MPEFVWLQCGWHFRYGGCGGGGGGGGVFAAVSRTELHELQSCRAVKRRRQQLEGCVFSDKCKGGSACAAAQSNFTLFQPLAGWEWDGGGGA